MTRVAAYTTEQLHALSSIIITGSVLSIIGSLFIILNYCLLKSLRSNFAFKLLLWVAITDLIDAIGSIVPVHKAGFGCTLQAITKSFGDNASLGWVVAISWTIYYLTNVTKIPTPNELNGLLKKMHIIIWSLAVLTTILPLTTGSYGVVGGGGWCWIKEDNSVDSMWRYTTFYIPLWISIVYMVVIYTKVWNNLKQRMEFEETTQTQQATDQSIDVTATNQSAQSVTVNEQREMKENERKKSNILQRMKYYPLILIVCYLFSSIRTISDDSGPGYAPYWLAVLHFIFESIIGFCDGIAYGMTAEIRKKDKELCGCYQGTVEFVDQK